MESFNVGTLRLSDGNLGWGLAAVENQGIADLSDQEREAKVHEKLAKLERLKALNMTLWKYWDDDPQPIIQAVDDKYSDNAASANIIQNVLSLAKYFEIPGSLLLSGFGIASNILVIAVFYRIGIISSSCTAIFTGIGMADLIYCLLTFASYARKLAEVLGANANPWGISILFAHVFRWMIEILIQFNCLATAYLAFERMISVMFPFRVKTYFSPKRSCCVLAAILVFVCALQFHVYLMHKVKWFKPSNGKGRLVMETSHLISVRTHTIGRIIYGSVVRPIAIALIVVFNAILVAKVRRADRFKQTMASIHRGENATSTGPRVGKKETKLIRMLLTLSAMMFVCYSPQIVLDLCYTLECPLAMVGYVTTYHPVFELANSCLNVWVYYVLSSNFKQELKGMCASCRRKQQ